jgi:nicotinamide mononucleotide transporter
MKRFDLWIGIAIGSALITASWRRWAPYSLTETLGFVTGAACVYLVVRQNVWNFPLGIANNIFFLILFVNARLYGDAGLQVIYIALGFQGWYYWLYGGQNRKALRITHASPRLIVAVGSFVVVGTAGLVLALRAARGAAPVMDAFTTVLSLAAQDLRLTAVLYFVFLCLCVAGFLSWRRALKAQAAAEGDLSKEAAASD